MNSEVCKIIQGLRLVYKSISLDELCELEEPRAEFEEHVAADVGPDFWIFLISSHGEKFLLDGDAMVLRASKFIATFKLSPVVEQQAQEFLQETIKLAKKFDANTGLQVTAEVRGVQ